MDRITDQLWISDISTVREQSDDRFDRVITVCQDSIIDNVGADTAYEYYCMADGEIDSYGGNNSYSLFKRATDSLVSALENDETVLIHCHMGQSRSVSVAIAALANYEVDHVRDVTEDIHDVRPSIGPDEHLWNHIERYCTEDEYADPTTIDEAKELVNDNE
jgi:hypothetical protein